MVFFNQTKEGMSLNPHYVTGLTESVGSFTYSQGTGGITIYFGIRSSVNDFALLLKVRDFWRVGKVYQGGGRDMKKWAYFRVNKLGELIKVVSHFEKYPLQGFKKHAFTIWREMVLCKRRKLPKDKERIFDLAEKLSKLNSG